MREIGLTSTWKCSSKGALRSLGKHEESTQLSCSSRKPLGRSSGMLPRRHGVYSLSKADLQSSTQVAPIGHICMSCARSERNFDSSHSNGSRISAAASDLQTCSRSANYEVSAGVADEPHAQCRCNPKSVHIRALLSVTSHHNHVLTDTCPRQDESLRTKRDVRRMRAGRPLGLARPCRRRPCRLRNSAAVHLPFSMRSLTSRHMRKIGK